MSIIEQDLLDIHGDKNRSFLKEVAKERHKARAQRNFVFIALKYLRDRKNIIPLIVLDNSDPLDSRINTILLWELATLSQVYNLKNGDLAAHQYLLGNFQQNQRAGGSAAPHAQSHR